MGGVCSHFSYKLVTFPDKPVDTWFTLPSLHFNHIQHPARRNHTYHSAALHAQPSCGNDQSRGGLKRLTGLTTADGRERHPPPMKWWELEEGNGSDALSKPFSCGEDNACSEPRPRCTCMPKSAGSVGHPRRRVNLTRRASDLGRGDGASEPLTVTSGMREHHPDTTDPMEYRFDLILRESMRRQSDWQNH
jgi:hypothetical protein